MVSRLLTPGLVLGVVADDGVRVGDGALDLLGGGLRLVEEVDEALRRGRRLAHLDRRVLEVVDLRRLLEDVRLRDREGLAEAAVEARGEVAGQLDVLALVLAHRDLVGLVEQDVRDLEDRVREQADARAVGALAGGLVLELGHAGRLAEAGEAVHDPGELGVLGDVALDEEGAALRVESRGEELGGGQTGVGRELLRVLRNRDRVQVDDHVERVVRLLQGHPLADGAEVVAEVERACGGLDSGEHAGSIRGHAHHSLRCRGPIRNQSETDVPRVGTDSVRAVYPSCEDAGGGPHRR
ncbi:hypothetical protein M2162_003291 [Streptomyces sp. SAI-041]|nr:hypothetical protein [Streptomyces sp. SAI-041]